jgi:hypothetical protein
MQPPMGQQTLRLQIRRRQQPARLPGGMHSSCCIVGGLAEVSSKGAREDKACASL